MKQTATITVTVTEAERAALLRIAARYGRTPGEIVRRIVTELARQEVGDQPISPR